MDTIELSCVITPYVSENSEILIALLADLGFESFMETKNGINAYIQADKFKVNEISKLYNSFNLFKFTFSFSRIKDKDWNEQWEKNYFKPIVIDNKCVIHASFHTDFPKVENEIIIDPKTAFGTGNHATTFLIIKEIFKLNLEEKKILDLGCGTAILTILSRKLNSGEVLAVDNDSKAITNSLENIKINQVDNIKLKEGTASDIAKQKFDIIYENIWKNTVINDMPITFNALNKGGTIILSGFYDTDTVEVKNAAEKTGFIYKNQHVKDKWAVMVFTKK